MKGYTFDRMKIQAANDGALYNLLNKGQSYAVSDLLNGVNVSTSGLNAYVDTGYLLIQGRFIEVTEKIALPLPTNSSGYIVFEIDLTEINEFSGTPGNVNYEGINNQLTLKYVESLTAGNLNNGDNITTFSLASFTTNGSTIKLNKNKTNYKNVSAVKDTGWILGSFIGADNIYYRRIGDFVAMHGVGSSALPTQTGSLMWAIPAGFRTDFPIGNGVYELGNVDSTPSNITIIEIRFDAMYMIYRNNNVGVSFNSVYWHTNDPFPTQEEV